jgi:hypothetical protein
MPSIFYKKNWEVVGPHVVKEVMGVLNGGPIPDDWNDTWVTLIPKVKNPEAMKDLRPISLCNVVYKLISKVLALRLKGILNEIIAPNQSAFVPGRLITDNILLAYEVTHHMKNKRSGAVGLAALKLDMSKAYDRVEWDFLEQMMRRLGFDEKWIALIMKCCNSVKYRFKLNGSLTEEVVPSRGLRQGDPISPYLFLICSEAFSCLLNSAEEDGRLEGVRVAPNAPSFNHLLFADDSLILMTVTEGSAYQLQYILSLYEECSGQTVNIDKSAIVFSKNTKERDKRKMMDMLGIRGEAQNEKYLGLPVYVGKSKTKLFAYLKDRLWSKITGWMEKWLSKMGKEVLIKACAQAIPLFAMSCFDITKELCDQMSTMVCRFWWAQQDNENKVHWMSWDKLSLPKNWGGLGYKDLHSFNLAMLAKQAWRLLTDPSSLCARVLKAKYFPDTGVLQAEPKEGMSYTWRSILKGIQLLKEGVIKRVGDGTSINVWQDPWVPREGCPFLITRRGNTMIDHVSELLDPISGSWDHELVDDCLWPADAIHVKKIPVCMEMEDFWAWRLEPKGNFSVKSAYKLHRTLVEPGGSSSGLLPLANEKLFSWNNIWSCPCPPNVKQFLWRLAHDSLPHRCNIARRGIEIDTLCRVCNRLNEDGAHVFLRCKGVKQVWAGMDLDEVRNELLVCDGPKEMLGHILHLNQKKLIRSVALLWTWWKHRNKINAGEGKLEPDEVIIQAFRCAADYDQFCVSAPKAQKTATASWCQPEIDCLKINTDGSFFASSQTGGWGFVMRDCNGGTVYSAAGRVDHASNALQTEALACLKALHTASDLGVHHVVLESDASVLIQAVSGDDFDRAANGVLFREIKSFSVAHFNSCIFKYCPRACNSVANALASYGSKLVHLPQAVWPGDAPDFVRSFVASDLAVLPG